MQTGHTFMAIKYFKKAAASMPASVYFANLAQALWSVGEVCLPFCGDCGCNPHTPRNADRRGYPRAANNSPHRRDAGCSFIHRKPLTAVPEQNPLDDHVCASNPSVPRQHCRPLAHRTPTKMWSMDINDARRAIEQGGWAINQAEDMSSAGQKQQDMSLVCIARAHTHTHTHTHIGVGHRGGVGRRC